MRRDKGILVVGLGAMGSAALYHLARREAAPVGIEQYAVGHASGSSHGHSRAFRTFYHDEVYVTLAEAALPLWRELETLSGEQLFTLSGAIFFAKPGNERFDQNIEVMQGLKVPYELLTAEEVTARFPSFHLPAGTVACYTPRSGFLDASRCVQAHVSQALRFGATVHAGVHVHHIDVSKERPEVETSEGRYRCSRLVVAPGPWASQILANLSLPLQVTRQQKFYFRPENVAAYQPHCLPVYADYDLQYYGFPYYGPGIKVADDKRGVVTSPEDVDRTLDPYTRDALGRWLETIMPGIDVSFVEGATCMYTLTPDHDFLIGHHPLNSNIFVGAGFSGHGFKFSTIVGKILAELATDGKTDYPIDKFRLSRFG
jgi:sarcosine oxidase